MVYPLHIQGGRNFALPLKRGSGNSSSKNQRSSCPITRPLHPAVMGSGSYEALIPVRFVVLTRESIIIREHLDTTLRKVLDEHAPLQKKRITARTAAPWINESVKSARKERRKAERKWKKTGSYADKDTYKKAMKNTANAVKKEKTTYLNDKINDSVSGADLFNICNQFLGKKKEPTLPNNIPNRDLPETFNRYFIEKIQNIRETLDSAISQPHYDKFEGTTLTVFKPVEQEFVRSIIQKSAKNFCELDPLPSKLFMNCLDIILPYITHILNKSLETDEVSDCFKYAIARSLLEKPTLDPNVMKNYRPVSNLPFLSKILEKIVMHQLNDHKII